MYAHDRGVRKKMRTAIQQDVRPVRQQVERHIAKLDTQTEADQRTAAHLQIRDADALAAQTSLNVDATQPFAYARPAVDAALSEVAASLERLENGGP
jgi:hypothetical protein